jgi:hypothetical protein
MSTINQTIDRLKRSFLVAPDNQPAMTTITTALTADTGDTAVTFGDFGLVEDEAYLMAGSIIELDRELVRIVSYDEGTNVAEIVREVDSTPLQAHDAGVTAVLAPPFPRQSMYEAVGDNIVRLYPRLFTVRVELLAAVGHGVYPLFDELAVNILSIWPQSQTAGVSPNYSGEIVDFHPTVNGRAVLSPLTSESVWVRYRRRMNRPEDVSDELFDLGVDPLWEEIIVVGAAADLSMNADLPYFRADFLGDVAENESIRFGSRTSVARALDNKREQLIDQAMREMRAEYKPVVNRISPWGYKSNAGVG